MVFEFLWGKTFYFRNFKSKIGLQALYHHIHRDEERSDFGSDIHTEKIWEARLRIRLASDGKAKGGNIYIYLPQSIPIGAQFLCNRNSGDGKIKAKNSALLFGK